jgi:glycosyltransferase involved in cell wall biosynthesis
MATSRRADTNEPIGLARLAIGGRNPYFDLLDPQLAAQGFTIVPEADFSVGRLLLARRKLAVLHFHWRPDVYYVWRPPRRLRRRRIRLERFQGLLTWLTLGRFAVRLLIARVLGYRVAWTIHELYPPETGRRSRGSVSRRVDRLAARLLVRASHVLIAHDDETAEKARDDLAVRKKRVHVVPHGSYIGVYPPGRPQPVHVVPHGSYIGVYPPGRPRSVVRAELRIARDAFVFLCFGALRPEKGIELLLEAFCELQHEKAILVVAGRPEDPASGRRTLGAFRADARIRPILGSVPNDRVAELFAAADAAVMPRSETWTSGSLILALSLGVPVVAARLHAYEELLGGERAGWLFAPGDADSLRETLERAARSAGVARAKGAAALRRAEGLASWDEIARRTAALLVASEANPRSVIRPGEALRGSE